MGTTTKGYPYPEGTDLVADGDNAIQALAEAINARVPYAMAGGVVSFASTKPGVTRSKTVTLPAGRFNSAPNVVTNPRTAEPATRATAAREITPASFTCMFQHTGSTASALNADYIAMQYGPGAAQMTTPLVGPATVTCPNPECENANLAIPVPTSWTADDDGASHPVDEYQCGVCGTDLSDTVTRETP